MHPPSSRSVLFLSAGVTRAAPRRLLALSIFATLVVLATGCASKYIPPGPRADLNLFAPPDIAANFSVQPAAPFPAALAVVRVQGPGYENFRLDHRGGGLAGSTTDAFTVVTVREVEEQAQLARVAALPKVAGITGVSRLLLPRTLQTERDLRLAVSRLQADLILLYTFDTRFHDDDHARPLTVVTLGLSPTRRIRATTTASALLVDTRTGYIHGTFEATERRDAHGSSWSTAENADRIRLETERAAFAKLVEEFASAWPGISTRSFAVATPPAVTSAASP